MSEVQAVKRALAEIAEETALTRLADRFLTPDEVENLRQEHAGRIDTRASFSDYLALLIDGQLASLYPEAVAKLERIGEPQADDELPAFFELSGLTPMQRGRAENHLRSKIRYQGMVMKAGQMYRKFEPVGKKISTANTRKRYPTILGGYAYEDITKEVYMLVHGNRRLDIPKMLYQVCTLPEVAP